MSWGAVRVSLLGGLMFNNREWWFLGPFIGFVLALVVIGVLV